MFLLNCFTEEQIEKGINPVISKGILKVSSEQEYGQHVLFTGTKERCLELSTMPHKDMVDEIKKEKLWFCITQGGGLWEPGTAYVFHEAELPWVHQTASNRFLLGPTTFAAADERADKFNGL